MVCNFAVKEIAPFIDQWEEDGTFSRETFRKAAELGMAGMYIPEEYGGSNLNYFMGALVIEELARSARAMNYLAVHNMVARQIFINGTEEQRQKYVLPLAQGERLASICITEPNAGSDISAMLSSAVRKGDDYILNGTKVFITGGGESDIYTVLCKTDKTKGVNGMSWLILEKGMDGFSFGKPEKKLAFNSVPVCQLFFEDCCVPATNRLGAENEGFKNFVQSINGGRVNVAAEAVGDPRRHSMPLSSMQKKGSSSGNRSPLFSLYSICLRTWRQNWRRLVSSFIRRHTCWITNCRQRSRFPWRSGLPPIPRCVLRRMPSRSSVATAT